MNKNISKKIIPIAIIISITTGCSGIKDDPVDYKETTEPQIESTMKESSDTNNTTKYDTLSKPNKSDSDVNKDDLSHEQNKSSNDTNHKTSPQNNITNKNKSNDTNKKSNTKDISKWEDYAQWSYDNYGSVPPKMYAYTDQDGNSVYYEDDNYNPDYPSSNTDYPDNTADINNIESATTE